MKRETKIIGGIVVAILIVVFFLLPITGTGLYFLTSWLAADKTAQTQAPKEETKKEETKKDLSGNKEEKKEESPVDTKNNPGTSSVFIKTNNGLITMPTTMSGNWGICAINGKLRTFILSSIAATWHNKRPFETVYMRGTHTNDVNQKVVDDGTYTYVDGDFITNAEYNQEDDTKTFSYDWCIEFWPKDGHFPHLGINDGTVSSTDAHIIGNRKAGFNFRYTVIEKKN